MKPMDYKKLFFIFLKKRRAYSKFKRNSLLALSSDPYMYISGAFYWEETHEGREYWNNLSDEWRKILCITNIKN